MTPAGIAVDLLVDILVPTHRLLRLMTSLTEASDRIAQFIALAYVQIERLGNLIPFWYVVLVGIYSLRLPL